jgi:hypothetical protein
MKNAGMRGISQVRGLTVKTSLSARLICDKYPYINHTHGISVPHRLPLSSFYAQRSCPVKSDAAGYLLDKSLRLKKGQGCGPDDRHYPHHLLHSENVTRILSNFNRSSPPQKIHFRIP